MLLLVRLCGLGVPLAGTTGLNSSAHFPTTGITHLGIACKTLAIRKSMCAPPLLLLAGLLSEATPHPF
jgi:hypothetical protein